MDTARLIRSFHDLNRLEPSLPVVTLFSGGLDSTYLLYRLASAGFTNVHAVSIDLGESVPAEYLRKVTESLSVQLHLVDARREFIDDFVRPAIAAQAVYLGVHPVSASLSRPLLAERATRMAAELDAAAVLHTANRSQNTLRRLNGAFAMLGYQGQYGSPYDREPVDRERKTRELESFGIDQPREAQASVDANLWCREFESGIIEDPEDHAVPEHFYTWSRHEGPLPPTPVEVGFENGVPVTVDGVGVPLGEMIEMLNHRVGAYGIGRYSGLEHLAGGQKVLEIREMPAAWLLLRSYRHIETAVLDAEAIREKTYIEQIWVKEALEGRWFGRLRVAAQAFIAQCSVEVTGSVRWRLRPGTADTTGIVAARPRYVRDRETWERSETGTS
ncbi:argininosuccinate synthase-related protein [Streptomyces anulatus]|uniref:argininosuccinate synthase-related protein n=1 Tax=Streptomyces anulatus TaxID=1892 RepID=UPI003442B5AC